MTQLYCTAAGRYYSNNPYLLFCSFPLHFTLTPFTFLRSHFWMLLKIWLNPPSSHLKIFACSVFVILPNSRNHNSIVTELSICQQFAAWSNNCVYWFIPSSVESQETATRLCKTSVHIVYFSVQRFVAKNGTWWLVIISLLTQLEIQTLAQRWGI